MLDKLTKATPGLLEIWMISAFAFGVGIGVYLADSLQNVVWWILGIGAVVHGWAMYRIYSKK